MFLYDKWTKQSFASRKIYTYINLVMSAVVMSMLHVLKWGNDKKSHILLSQNVALEID